MPRHCLHLRIVALVALFLSVNIGAYAAGIISTIAGTIDVGDGGPATNAHVFHPTDVAVDARGNLYIADQSHSRIRKVDASGIITTVAGNGTEGYSGDGGRTTDAALYSPRGVAVDTAGNLYIADMGNQRIRKVDTSGTIVTIAGSGASGYAGDGGSATDAELDNPAGVALDATGNIYIADRLNHRIRKVDSSGTITTVAGNGTDGYSGDGGLATDAALSSPEFITIDTTGNLYIGDIYNHRIRKVDVSGTITTVAGGGSDYLGDGGPATNAALNHPYGVAVDAAGNLYFTESGNDRVRKVDAAGTISTVADPGTGAGLYVPLGIALDAGGNLYIADLYNNRIRKVDTVGIIATVAGNGAGDFGGDGGASTGAVLSAPIGIATDSGGNIYFADLGNDRIRKVDASGTITTVAGNGALLDDGDGKNATSAALNDPTGVAVDAHGNLYIAELSNHRIRRVDSSGTITTVAGNGLEGYSGDGGPATEAQLAFPRGVAVDTRGNLYIAEQGNHRIRKVDVSGTITTVAGNGIEGYSGDDGPANNAELNHPSGVAIDTRGNLYIADLYNHRVRKVDSFGIITTVAGNGTQGFSGDGGLATDAELAFPYSMAIDVVGNLYIADAFNHRIRKVDTTGTITTVAGNGIAGYDGDGGAATDAALNRPSGVAVDASGNLYIADSKNNRIRFVANSDSGGGGGGVFGFDLIGWVLLAAGAWRRRGVTG